MTVLELDGTQQIGKWSGSEVISYQEYSERAARGEVKDGPRFTAAFFRHLTDDTTNKRTLGPTTPVIAVPKRSDEVEVSADSGASNSAKCASSQPSPPARRWIKWEQYVHDFIAEYELDSDQQQKAVMLLLRCEVRGDSFLASKSDVLKKLETERLDPAKKVEADEKLAKLLEPIDEIFERNLKPGLEKLPTRAQHAAVEKRTAEERKEPGK